MFNSLRNKKDVIMSEEFYTIVAYDIRDGKRLAGAARCLSSYGQRLQKSIFEVHAEKQVLDRLKRRLGKIISDEDFVLFIPICEHDRKKQKFFGAAIEKSNMEKPCLIF